MQIDGEHRGVINTQSTAEIADKPLQLQLGNFIACAEVQPDGQREAGWHHCETGNRAERNWCAPDIQVKAADAITGANHGHEWSERDIGTSVGLLNAFEKDSQPWLTLKSQRDRIGKRQRLARREVEDFLGR